MKISVIIPVYNVESYLPRCMASVLSQTHEDLEIILVDDGSKDSSGKLCDEYGKQDPRIKVIHKPNGGLSDARNAGLEVATGEYVGFVDSDDWIEADMFERMSDCCVESGAQVAICRYKEENSLHNTKNRMGVTDSLPDISIGEVGNNSLHKTETSVPTPGTSPAPVYRSPELLSRERALEIYLTDPEGYSIYNSVWSKLFQLSLVRDMRFFTGHNSEDIPYTTEAFCRMEKVIYLDEALYHYVVAREGGIMAQDAERLFRDEIPHWRWQRDCIRRYGMEKLAKLSEYQYYKRMLVYDLRLDEVSAARLEDMLFAEEDRIRKIYDEDFVKRSDRLRMKLFLQSPALYRNMEKLHRKIRKIDTN